MKPRTYPYSFGKTYDTFLNYVKNQGRTNLRHLETIDGIFYSLFILHTYDCNIQRLYNTSTFFHRNHIHLYYKV